MGHQLSTSSSRLFAAISLSILLGIWIYAVYPILHHMFKHMLINQQNITKFIAIIGIILFSAYLIYRKRFKLKHAHYSISILAIIAVIFLQFGYILGIVYKLNSVDVTAIILMLPALVLLCYGSQVFEVIFFPVLYFLLIIPLLHTDFQYDTYLYWFAVAVGYGYIRYKSFLRRTILAITAVVSPLLMQYGFLKMFFKNPQFSQLPYREWLPFLVSILGVGFIAHVLKEPRRVFISAISPLEFERSENGLLNKMGHWVVATLLIGISISFMPRFIASIQNRHWDEQDIQAFISSGQQNTWEGPAMVTGDVWKPIFLAASDTRQTLYLKKDNASTFGKSIGQKQYKQDIVYLSKVSYTPNLSTQLLLNDKNYFYNPNVWNPVASKNVKIKLANQKRLHIVENIVEVKGVQRLIWSWYYVRGFNIQPQSQLFYLIDLISSWSQHPEASTVMVLSTPLTDLEESRTRLHLFLEDQYRN